MICAHNSCPSLGIISVVFGGRVRDGKRPGRSVADHVREARQAILQESSSPSLSGLGKVRRLLSPPPSPFTPHHTSNWHSQLQGALLTIAFLPKPHPTSATYMIATVVSRGRRKCTRAVHVDKVSGEAVEEALQGVNNIMRDAKNNLASKRPRCWWKARVHFNARLQECLGNARLKQCLQCVHLHSAALSFPLLVLGRRLHNLPWECMFKDLILTRSPSLWFATAHRMLVSILIRWPGRTPPGCKATRG